MNSDFRDMLSALSDENAEFLVVGAYSLAAHGVPKSTGAIDLWIRPSPINAKRVSGALKRFRAPLRELTVEDLTTDDVVFQIGIAPRRIDLLTSITGVAFEEAWEDRMQVDIEGVPLAVISRDHLLQNKRATGRPKDMADVAWLEQSQD